jgi:hypothetical protein
MAEYYGVTTFAAPPSADTSINNVATTTNVQVDAVAYAALQQSLAGNYVSKPTSGTASATTYLRGDGTWAAPAGSGTSNIALDTDGVPYFQTGASGATIAADTDGVPYFQAAS